MSAMIRAHFDPKTLKDTFRSFEYVAARLDRSRSFVVQEVRRGRLHAVHFGARCHLITRESFEAYMRARGLEP